ncbi:ABC transporter permease [Pseudothermotoga thermarum]|uniref:ABC3 transporter permease C-terminal domain-containing protein n=1 Tax=Pseudothermotoga thermarum DSM 5069 TaxID=688269 RepID=F7YUG7_9THEM|nr:ABC transporter permease [Pseudothermotoga thermarum]AEH51438.1 protein of unknown function DUF214 [Pseudothermotoga thermarum DSM 5069]
MLKTILKIAFRNFKAHFKTAFVLILGISIPSMLIVGGLSINDSIKNWVVSSFSKNFGPADAYVENRRNNIFMKFSLDEQIVSSIASHEKVKKILPVSETVGRIMYEDKSADCLIIGVYPEDLKNFVDKQLDLFSGEVIISRSLANLLKISLGVEVVVNVGAGEKKFTVTHIGEDGFLNFRGENLHYLGTIFVHIDDFAGPGGFPTRIYLNLNGKLEEHSTIVEDLRKISNVRAVAMKFQLLNSPANRALGYVTIAFSGFSILASFILVYLFAKSFAEERSSTMVILRTLGMKTIHIMAAFFIEGLAYLLVAGIFGGFFGILLARYLLEKFIETVKILNVSFVPSFEGFSLHVTFPTVLLGIFAGLVVPMLIFLRKIWQITNKPPVQMFEVQVENLQSLTFKKAIRMVGLSLICLGILTILFIGKFQIFGILSLAVGLTLIFLNPIVSLLIGVFLTCLISYLPPSQNVGGWEILQRGAAFYISAWLIFAYAIFLARRFLSKFVGKASVSSFIALSYVERNWKNSFIIASMFSLIVFVMTLVITVHSNVQRFVKQRMENGLFGYDFIVIRNPLKLIFSKSEIEICNGILSYSRVYVAEFENDLIVFVDENFLKQALVPFETDPRWREKLLEPGKAIVGYLQKNDLPTGKTVSGRVRSPFRIGGTSSVELEVVDVFDMRQLLVPTKYVASTKSLPKEVRPIPVLLAKIDPENVSQIKSFYSKLFDFPIHVKEELNKLFSGIDLLVQTAVVLLYFGLISGFSAIAFHSLRSVVVRRRLTGTLMAVGMSSYNISLAFILENIVIASIGILVGSFAGYFESRNVLRLIFELFGSGEFSFPLKNFVLLIIAIYTFMIIAVSLPVVLTKKSPAEALRAPD